MNTTDVPLRSAKWIAGLVLVIAFLGSIPVVARNLTVFVSPVRFRGVAAFDRSASDTPVPPAAQQLSAAQLAAWRHGADSFTSKADIGFLLFVLGCLGLCAALFVAMQSMPAGAVTAALSLASLFGGYVHNRRLARRHLLCPQCGRYPRGDISAATDVPAFVTWEVGGMCVHCGTMLPPDP
jgi:hypothetical protein